MNKSKGFTIIELIVVIAIIAILATIVLVNVTGYINKSKDAAAKANIDTIMTNAAVFFADTTKGNGSFNAFKAASEYTIPAGQINTQLGAAPTATCNDTGGTCTASTATAFCVSAALKDGTTYCKDSSGRLGTTTCAAGVCP